VAVEQTLILDGVPLTVRTPWLPEAPLSVSPPGNALQSATWSTLSPYAELTLIADPFGWRIPTERTPVAKTGGAQDLRDALRQGRARQNAGVLQAPEATLFGQACPGSASEVELDADGGPTRAVIVEWVAEAGPRLWLLRCSRERRDEESDADVQAFVASLSTVEVTSTGVDNPTTLAGQRDGLGGTGTSVTIDRAGSPMVPTPSWWNGPLDDTTYRSGSGGLHSYALGAAYGGLVPCGPRPAYGEGPDVLVQFFPGGHGQFEWECVELSMRWMYLAYGVAPYPGNGNQVVKNYPNSHPNGLLEVIVNGTVGKAPVPGDVLSYGPTSQFGHTSVAIDSQVDATTGNGTVTVLEQNASPNGRTRLTVNRWVVDGNGMAVSGWLHLRGSGAGPSLAPSGDAPAEDRSALRAFVVRCLWGALPFSPDFAIPKAWQAEWVAGRYRGRPVCGEVPVPDLPGAVFQVFERGLAVWVPGHEVSWQG
jgi:hypothetical protein